MGAKPMIARTVAAIGEEAQWYGLKFEQEQGEAVAR
jgi:hypothetical protein